MYVCYDSQKESVAEIETWENIHILLSTGHIHETALFDNKQDTTQYILEVSRRYQSQRRTFIKCQDRMYKKYDIKMYIYSLGCI